MTDNCMTLMPVGTWQLQCSQRNLFFASSDWFDLLESAFAAKTACLWNEPGKFGATISVFPAGPFQVAYLGFPVGGLVGDEAPGVDQFIHQGVEPGGSRPVALRIPVSGFAPPIDLQLPWVATPETAITDLQSWSLDDASLNHRRDVQKAVRSGVIVEDASDDRQAAEIYAIYKATLKRHGGGLRYNLVYFEELVRRARENANVRAMLATHSGDVAGFLVVARHGDTGFYLHGGMRHECRHLRPSALLMHRAIQWAQESACDSYNLMSSPPGQESLVRYKEKWGAETREHRTYTLRISAGYHLFRFAERLYRFVR